MSKVSNNSKLYRFLMEKVKKVKKGKNGSTKIEKKTKRKYPNLRRGLSKRR